MAWPWNQVHQSVSHVAMDTLSLQPSTRPLISLVFPQAQITSWVALQSKRITPTRQPGVAVHMARHGGAGRAREAATRSAAPP